MTLAVGQAARAAHAQTKLRVRGVSKSYGATIALHPTDLELREGEFLTLLGPSGSGKTTLLMLVAGLLAPDEGTIHIDGADCTFSPTDERDIGMVFQNYALFPHLTVFENVAFPLRMRRWAESDIRREVGRVLEIVSLPNVADRLPRALSGGQQQRIALARCIVYKPSIILMDEPLSALDRKLREQLQDEIRNLHRKLGTTVLFVTHDQGEALTMSDRICVMSEGRVEQIGAPEDIYARPKTLFAAVFLGESNIFDATSRSVDGDVVTFDIPDLGEKPVRVLAPGISRGRKVKLMLRPEQIAFGPGGPGTNALQTRVVDRSFSGAMARYSLLSPGGRAVNVTSLTASGGANPIVGNNAEISWAIDGAVVVDDGSRTP